MKPGFYGFVADRPMRGNFSATGQSGHRHYGFGHVAFAHSAGKIHLADRPDTIFGLDGAWLNAPRFDWDKDPNSAENAVETSENFGKMRGPVQGFHFDKTGCRLTIHTDAARQRPFFYHFGAIGFVFASSLALLADLLRQNDISLTPDTEGAAALLAFGSIPGEKTLVGEIAKTRAGTSIEFEGRNVRISAHTKHSGIKRSETSESEAIERLHEAFTKAVKRMTDYNRSGGFAQYNLLSGGIDSRLVFMETNRQNPDVRTICFSKAGYWDQQISRQIAQDFGAQHTFFDLRDGQYLTRQATMADYDGTINYLASSHHRSMLDTLRPEQMGLLAAGQLGNEIMGEFLQAGPGAEKIIRSLLTAPEFYNRCEHYLQKVWNESLDPVVFKLLQRAFLFTNSAAYSTSEHGLLYSPFTDPDFLKIALSLPERYLKGQSLYLKWIAAKYPEAQRYDWERYRAKPVLGPRLTLAKWRMKVLTRWVYPRQKFRTGSMNPLEYWVAQSPDLQRYFEKTYKDNKSAVQLFPGLQAQIEDTFRQGSVFNKASVLTLLVVANNIFRNQ